MELRHCPVVQDQTWFSLSDHGRYDDDDDDDDDTCLKADVPRMSERSMRYTRLTNKLTTLNQTHKRLTGSRLPARSTVTCARDSGHLRGWLSSRLTHHLNNHLFFCFFSSLHHSSTSQEKTWAFNTARSLIYFHITVTMPFTNHDRSLRSFSGERSLTMPIMGNSEG